MELDSPDLLFRSSNAKRLCVFLHGFLGRKEDWLPIFDDSPAGFDLLAVDLPFHSATGRQQKFESLQAYLEALNAWLLKLPYQEFALCGYSLGGRVAFQLLRQEKLREKLFAVAIESAHPGLESPRDFEERCQLEEGWKQIVLDQGVRYFLEYWMAQSLFTDLAQDDRLSTKLLEDRERFTQEQLVDGIDFFGIRSFAPVWNCLGSWRLPFLLFAGAKDKKYCQLLGRAEKLLPKAELVVLPQCGHNTHLVQADSFQRRLFAFYQRSARSET